MAKKTTTITLHMSEIIYDVQNKTYLTGRSRYDGKNYEHVANMQANDDDENLNQVLRSVGNALANLKNSLAEYISEDTANASNLLRSATTDFVVALSMPSNFNQASTDTIAVQLHQYVVNFAIGEWFVVTSKDDAQHYLALSAANLEQLRAALNKRVRPLRKTNMQTETAHETT